MVFEEDPLHIHIHNTEGNNIIKNERTTYCSNIMVVEVKVMSLRPETQYHTSNCIFLLSGTII
jgi:hypothetical protein